MPELAGTRLTATREAVPEPRATRFTAIRDAVGAVVGAALGIAPHVLHHIGLIAGTAFAAGAGGNALFYVVGLLLSVPMLRRLYRRFGTWLAPAIAVLVFTVLFSVSALVIGPSISADSTPGSPSTPSPSTPSPSTPGPSPAQTEQHSEHHT